MKTTYSITSLLILISVIAVVFTWQNVSARSVRQSLRFEKWFSNQASWARERIEDEFAHLKPVLLIDKEQGRTRYDKEFAIFAYHGGKDASETIFEILVSHKSAGWRSSEELKISSIGTSDFNQTIRNLLVERALQAFPNATVTTENAPVASSRFR